MIPALPEMIPALEVRELQKRYGRVHALQGVSLEVSSGECVALVGESGSGKTTLLRAFNRVVEPDGGVVLVKGRPARDLDPIRLRRETGYVPQEGGLMPHWTVRKNAALVARLLGMADADERADSALELLGLSPNEYARRWPRELSGGQRQRVAIARALATGPEVVLLDEPFGALDAITRAQVRGHFKAIRQELGTTSVLVTHDLHEAIELADRVAVLRDGRIEQAATPDVLVEKPATSYVARLLEQAGLVGAREGGQ